MIAAYRLPLPEHTTLCVYDGDTLIFSNGGKWLMPLFALEDFFKTYDGSRSDLCAHDTAVGKAACVLMIRMGIKKIHANIASALAIDYVAELNRVRIGHDPIELSYDTSVRRLLCATEDRLETMHDSDEMYTHLRFRAKLVQGVDVCVRNLSAPYGFIKNISFAVNAGGRLMIAGENGAGKTTLLRLLIGMIPVESGEILIDGVHPSKLPKRTIGYIPQAAESSEYSLSVEEVVSLGLPPRVKNGTSLIRKALARVDALRLSGRSFASLSGGEKQKVSFARCLAQNAKLLLLDEPTAALDTESRAAVMEILHSLSVSEIPTVIIVTHDEALLRMAGWQVLRLGEAAAEDAGGVCE
ncbi:DUF1893 domain-containing protein [Treponema socranskii]|uniref:DUF1893 domain-containing protein n=1 Tax=Treponema socranskii TaxID=53419 RepID=UPI003D6EE314